MSKNGVATLAVAGQDIFLGQLYRLGVGYSSYRDDIIIGRSGWPCQHQRHGAAIQHGLGARCRLPAHVSPCRASAGSATGL
ncbi:hypothetical protein [Albibacterium indicum]|uniref:hypothetical protein n=1 Tax=Albibacterium indicum TaxID=2292082 RepID=UPI0013009DEC|nr:hypothetical protein [Pedobacter indicus]